MGEKLYNNIELPDPFPPRYSAGTLADKMPVPYLENPPEVIDISVGRQLFADDFLIRYDNLYRVCHRAKKYEGNPVLFPETVMEKHEKLPCACPKSGGVWYDREDGRFKMWYEAGWLHKLAYAESDDGIHWNRPNLHITEGTNEILPSRSADEDGKVNFWRPDSQTVFIDYDAPKEEKYKLFLRNPGFDRPGIVAVSGDGIHFDNEKARHTAQKQGDRSTVFYNPFRKKWVYSIRASFAGQRAREYAECDDFLSGADWTGKNVPWLCCDRDDKPNPYIGVKPELYNADCVAYESLMLGLFQIYYGPDNKTGFMTGAPKITELIPMFSRDGFHFTRASSIPLINASMVNGAWDRGYVQSVGGVCLVRKDELWFYYTGFSGDEAGGGKGNPNDCQFDTMYSGGACGLAKLRRDGFVSLEAENDGNLQTRKLTFHGRRSRFFVNADIKEGGALCAEIYDESGKLLARSRRFVGDSTCAELDFGSFDLASLEGTVFTLTFYINNGGIYSFWFSDSEDGDSYGYDAAGTIGR